MGQRDIPLNDEGREQALLAGCLLQKRNIRTVLASPLIRAHETANIIAGIIGVPVFLEKAFMERAWGIYEGHGRSIRPLHIEPIGGETSHQFFDRTSIGLGYMNKRLGPVLVVAHSGTYRVLRCWLGMPITEDVIIQNASPLYYEQINQGWHEKVINTPLN